MSKVMRVFHRRARIAAIATVAILSFSGSIITSAAHAQITLIADRGRIDQNGVNQNVVGNGYGTNHNLQTGFLISTGVEYRSYLLFSIPVGTYSSAILRTNSSQYFGDASETVLLFDYAGTATSLFTERTTSNTTGQAIFADLGGGVSYGSVTYTGTNQVMDTALSASAISNINAVAGGVFILGGRLQEISGQDLVFAVSQGQPDTAYQLVLTSAGAAAPEPASLALLLTLLATAGVLPFVRSIAQRRRKDTKDARAA